MDKLVQNPECWLIVLAPLFVIMMVLEYWLGQRGNRLPSSAQYSLKELACNFSLAGLHQLTDLVAGLFIAKLYLLVFGWKLFDIKMSLCTGQVQQDTFFREFSNSIGDRSWFAECSLSRL